MKTINEMSEQEILSLTDDQLQTLIKIRMAEEGIKILNEPMNPEYLPIAEANEVAYKVKGFDFVFIDKEVAAQASEMILGLKQSMRDEAYGKHYNLKYLTTSGSYKSIEGVGEIQPQKFYSRKLTLEIEDAYSANENLKKQYDEALKEYSENYGNAAYIREEIYGRYREVADKQYRMESMKSKYHEYLSLAENDSSIAMKFLKKAYHIDEETEAFVTSEAPITIIASATN